MSMIGEFLQITPAQLSAVIADPPSVDSLVYPEDDVVREAPDAIDLDKAWHLIHFLLNGQAWEGEPPLFWAVLGGTELEDTDGGYGPVRYLTPERVASVAAALDAVTPEALWANFDAERTRKAEIYPEGWGKHESDRDYILNYFVELQEFYRNAQQRGNAVLQYIS